MPDRSIVSLVGDPAGAIAIGFASPHRRRLLILAVALALISSLAFAAESRAAANADFTYSPSNPVTGQRVTFTSTSTGTVSNQSWDLDNDASCDDAIGPVAHRTFTAPGNYGIRLCVNGDESEKKLTITVRNRPPVAGFTVSPSRAVVGDPVTLTSTSFDPDGQLAGQSWALFGNELFGSGATVTRSWATSGVYPVTLRVQDSSGASSSFTRWIPIHHRPLELLSPFPVVRLAGRISKSGALVTRLLVQAPRGAHVAARCSGRRCPYRRASAMSSGSVRFRRLQRFLPSGTKLVVSVTKPGTIGKYVRFRIRAGHSPLRVDRCIKPGAKRPVRCPTT